MNHGYEEGAICGRTSQHVSCKGVIAFHPVVNCSCHIAPPCAACTTPRAYCPECGWEEKEEEVYNDHVITRTDTVWKDWGLRPLRTDRIDWYPLTHTNSSMRKKGTYPEGTTQAEVLKLVEGTFGGRFEQFGNGTFDYIAYTD